MLKSRLERTYNKTMNGAIKVVNPIKKRVKKTECIVHKFINKEAINLLCEENKLEEYKFYMSHISDLNRGVKWADADLKSTNHFYHHEKGKGLYGFSNAKDECLKYYNEAINLSKANDVSKSIFFLGAACHLVQDSTVPAHAMKNLKKHKPLEKYIVNKVLDGYSTNIKDGIIRYPLIEEYIINNTREAVITNKEFQGIVSKSERFEGVSEIIIAKAVRTTAGILIDFYESIKNN